MPVIPGTMMLTSGGARLLRSGGKTLLARSSADRCCCDPGGICYEQVCGPFVEVVQVTISGWTLCTSCYFDCYPVCESWRVVDVVGNLNSTYNLQRSTNDPGWCMYEIAPPGETGWTEERHYGTGCSNWRSSRQIRVTAIRLYYDRYYGQLSWSLRVVGTYFRWDDLGNESSGNWAWPMQRCYGPLDTCCDEVVWTPDYEQACQRDRSFYDWRPGSMFVIISPGCYS